MACSNTFFALGSAGGELKVVGELEGAWRKSQK